MAQTRNELDAAAYVRLAGFDSDWRDRWWNDDYLALLARRTGLADRRRVLDVGCGAGHWGLRLLPLCHPAATLVGIDREGAFLDSARERAAARGLASRSAFHHGRAEAIDAPDGAFDLVTAQTVLMHVTRADAVLAELVRVLAPGGLLLVAEPDNLVNALSPDRGPSAPTAAETLALVELQLTCARGKEALGHGDESVGARLFPLFHAAGLARVRVWTNDRAAPLEPPYADPAQAQDRDIIRHGNEYDGVLEERSRRHFLAGGGGLDRFAALWARRQQWQQRARAGVARGTHRRAGGFMMYVCAGEKPA